MSYRTNSFKLKCNASIHPKKPKGSSLIFAEVTVRCFEDEYLDEAKEVIRQLQELLDEYDSRKV